MVLFGYIQMQIQDLFRQNYINVCLWILVILLTKI